MNRFVQALCGLLSLAGVLRGEIRTSANYSIATDVTDSAGGRSTSALYTHDASAGGITGIATVSSPAEANKAGYIGQLEDEATYDLWILAALPPGSTPAQLAGTADFDQDGATNFDEWLALTNPASGGSRFVPTSTPSGANLLLRFPSAVGRSYVLRQNDTLVPGLWINAPAQTPLTGTGAILTFTVPQTGLRRFYYIQPGLP